MEKAKVRIAFLSTYPPRECGLATFTKAMVRTFDELYVKNQVKIIAASDTKYLYSPRVVFDIDQFNEQSYVDAANFINKSSIEVISLQHEYGIFGGEDGKFIIKFLENVNKPVVISLHSVLREHSEHRHKVTQRILDLSSSIVVMTKDAKKALIETFKIEPQKIRIVHHGVPNVRYDEKEPTKELLGLKDKIVLSTFGLMGPSKGIETAIKALPQAIKKFPNIVYLVIGATHPTIRKHEGEKYRESLIELVKKKKLEDHVKFINRYLEYEELVDFLKATDVYLAPQRDLHQAFSGTLSYAIGCGSTAISTPTNYAKEILASSRGIITSQEPEIMAKDLIKVLSSPTNLEKMRLSAYRFARRMIWPSVALDYLKVIESNLYIENKKWKDRLPKFSEPPSLKYMQKLTDDFGIIQHAKFAEPDKNFGYSMDDQARALIVCKKMLDVFPKTASDAQKLLKIYFRFLKFAVDKDGIIHNFVDIKRKYADEVASDDSMARSFWALSIFLSSKNITPQVKEEVKKLIIKYRKNISSAFIKPAAFNLLAFCQLKDRKEIEQIADLLIYNFKESSEKGLWEWFEDKITYGNAIVPFSLIKAYQIVRKPEYLKIAMQAITFLEKVYYDNGIPSPVGQNGWYFKGKKKAIFDQQPIEAADMVLMYNELFNLTKDKKYREKTVAWMGWYFGNNIKQVMVYDNTTRGIFDGITREGVNKNHGAESIVTYLMAYLSFDKGL